MDIKKKHYAKNFLHKTQQLLQVKIHIIPNYIDISQTRSTLGNKTTV